jgi:hypothetical protein
VDIHVDVLARGPLGDVHFMESATKGCCAIIDLVCQMTPPCEGISAQLANDVAVLDAVLFAGLASGARVIFASGNFSLPTRGRWAHVLPMAVLKARHASLSASQSEASTQLRACMPPRSACS